MSILSIAVILCILGSYTVPVHGQTTSISDLTYPTAALVGGQADVSFTVTYSTSEAYSLEMGVSFDVSPYVSGELVSASPSTCISNSGTAACVMEGVSGSGSEHVEFTFNLDTTAHTKEDYTDLVASALFVDTSSNKMISGSASLEGFSINITNTLSSNSNYVTVVSKATGPAPTPIDPTTVGAVVAIVFGGLIIGVKITRRPRNRKQ
jgi:hypothetical protein